MAEKFEDKYLDVLQNIEFSINSTYRRHPEMTDHQVDKVVEGLVRVYIAEQRGKSTPALRFTPLEQELYDDLKQTCDWRLGRSQPVSRGNVVGADITPKTVDEIIACLKRIRSSIRLWTKEYGRQGYLNYIDEFFPS